jgi:hypothetical protein
MTRLSCALPRRAKHRFVTCMTVQARIAKSTGASYNPFGLAL